MTNFKQLFFAFLLLSSIESLSQNIKVFYDNFGVQGKVSYSGIWSDTSLPQKGKYEIKWRSFTDANLYTFNVLGSLVDGLPSGKWLWEQASWNYTVEPGRDIEPIFSTQGERFLWQANFVNGKAEGNWNYLVDSMPQTNSNKKRNLTIQATFKNGKMVGNFKIEDNRLGYKFVVSGECDEKGAANGNWVIKKVENSIETLEIRNYDKGVLLNVYNHKINGKDTLTSVFSLTRNIECINKINQGESGLDFRISEKEFESDMNESPLKFQLIDYLYNHFFKGWSLPIFYANIQRNGPVFKQIEYPITPKEDSLITVTKDKTMSLLTEISKRQKYANLYINRGRSLELDLAIGYMEHSYSKLSTVDSLLDLKNHPMFTFKSRNEVDSFYWDKLLNKDLVVDAAFFENNNVSYPMFKNEKNQELFFEKVNSYINKIEEELNIHLKEIDKSFTLIQREGELLNIENRLTESLSKLENNYGDIEGIGSIVFERWVHGYIKLSIQDYSKETDFSKLKNKAKVIQSEMDSFIVWLQDWQRIDSMQKNLREFYTVYEYNPYTGKRDIEIRKKRRFYNKIETAFWPWMLDMLQNAKTWEEFVEHKQNVEIAFNYLSHFASADDKSSKRIEKRIRKEKSNERILRIILSHV